VNGFYPFARISSLNVTNTTITSSNYSGYTLLTAPFLTNLLTLNTTPGTKYWVYGDFTTSNTGQTFNDNFYAQVWFQNGVGVTTASGVSTIMTNQGSGHLQNLSFQYTGTAASNTTTFYLGTSLTTVGGTAASYYFVSSRMTAMTNLTSY
jgi:hypothetical protein